jgi:hypothetical protein
MRLNFDNYIIIEDMFQWYGKENGVQNYITKHRKSNDWDCKTYGLLGREHQLLRGLFSDKSLTETLTAAAMRISIFKK